MNAGVLGKLGVLSKVRYKFLVNKERKNQRRWKKGSAFLITKKGLWSYHLPWGLIWKLELCVLTGGLSENQSTVRKCKFARNSLSIFLFSQKTPNKKAKLKLRHRKCPKYPPGATAAVYHCHSWGITTAWPCIPHSHPSPSQLQWYVLTCNLKIISTCRVTVSIICYEASYAF